MMLRAVAFVFSGFFLLCAISAGAQEMPPSQCQAIASKLPGATFARFTPSEFSGFRLAQANPVKPRLADQEVRITYVGHSTYQIESPGGVVIATDYSGFYKPPLVPDVVTMNKAHSSHYTTVPDPEIGHVLHGWSDVPGEKAEHRIVVGDAYIRNVATDIRSWGGDFEANGNSIFIFETAGLCIGHLGHLHHELTDSHYTEIGRLDVLMVPVDGGLTMGADSMSRVVERLRSSLILPMHRPQALAGFLGMLDGRFDVAYAGSPTITVSLRTLPKKPTITVPKGMY